jgi:hypothetical protein
MSDDNPQIIYRQDHRATDLHAIVADGLFLKNGTLTKITAASIYSCSTGRMPAAASKIRIM